MRFETFVALRYLRAPRRRAHVALIAWISVAGLAVGVAALIVSLALLSGFQDRIRLQMVERSAHLRVEPSRGALLREPEKVRAMLDAFPGTRTSGPALEGRGWASDLEGAAGIPVRFRSGPERGDEAVGASDARVASGLAARLHVGEEDLIRVTSSRTRLSPIGLIPVAIVLRVSEIHRAGAFEKSAEIEVSEETARLLSGTGTGAAAWEVRLSDPAAAEDAARAARRTLGPEYRVKTWRELNAPLAFALRLEKFVIFVTVALVILVAALNIVSNIALTVVEKKRDLGVFSSMGARPGSLVRIYLTVGAIIGLVGTAAGVAVGTIFAIVADRFGLVRLPKDVYLMKHVPFAVYPSEVAAVALFAFVTALLAAVLPARAAARLAPGEAIRLSR